MDDRERKIRDEAYRIWDEAGRPKGRDAEHWDEAERRLFPTGTTKSPATKRSVKSPSGSKTAAKTAAKTVAKNAGNSGVAAPSAKVLKGAAVDVAPSKTAPKKPPAAAKAPTKALPVPPPKAGPAKPQKPKAKT